MSNSYCGVSTSLVLTTSEESEEMSVEKKKKILFGENQYNCTTTTGK